MRHVILGLVLAVLGLHAVGVVQDMAAAVRYPYGMDYGEGIVWEQGRLIPGALMYARPVGLPMIVFHYPPVFYLLTHAVERFGWDGLAAGRIVAGASTVAACCLAGALVLLATAGKGWRRMAMACLAGLLLLTLDAVRVWALVARVDMPGVALALAGLVVAARADGRFAGTLLALLLCGAAVFTKQTLLAAGAAVVLVGLVRRPRQAAAATAVAGAVGIGVLLWLQALTDGGFVTNILGNNLNRMSITQALQVLATQADIAPQVALMLGAAGFVAARLARAGRVARGWAAIRGMEPHQARRLLLLLHFGLSGLSLVTIGKVGGNFNYLIEWLSSGAVLLGIGLVHLAETSSPRARIATMAALLVIGVTMSFTPLRVLPDIADAADLAVKRGLVERIAAAPQPVASEEMTLLLRAGKPVVYEPSIVTELAHVGRWDEAPLVAMMATGGFAFVLTADGDAGPNDRRTPGVNAAMQAAYPRMTRLLPRLWIREKP